MATIERFEDIEARQEARSLVRAVYLTTGKGAFSHDFGLRDQIQRAAVSAMSNIAEGFERGSNREFLQFLYIAKGSIGEVRSQLYAALDLGYITGDDFDRLSSSAFTVSKKLSTFIKYLQGSAFKGSKFKVPEFKVPDRKETRDDHRKA